MSSDRAGRGRPVPCVLGLVHGGQPAQARRRARPAQAGRARRAAPPRGPRRRHDRQPAGRQPEQARAGRRCARCCLPPAGPLLRLRLRAHRAVRRSAGLRPGHAGAQRHDARPGRGRDPVASVAPVHDVGTAALATLGILAALFARARTGRGQHVTASLAASSVFLQSGELTTFAGRPAATAGGVDFPGPSAVRRYYPASDGWLAVSATTAAEVAGLLSAVGHPQWGGLDDAALADRLAGALAERPAALGHRAGRARGPGLPGAAARRGAGRPVPRSERVLARRRRPRGRPAADCARLLRLARHPPGVGAACRGAAVGEETSAVLAAAGLSLTS